MEFILQLVSVIAFYISSIYIFEKLYKRREYAFWEKALVVVLFALSTVFLSFIKQPILNFSYSLITIIILNKFLYEPQGKSYIVYNMILVVVMMAIEMFSVSLFSLVMNIEITEIINNSYLLFASAILGWILLFIAVRVYALLVTRKQINRVKIQELLFFIILVVAEILFLHAVNSILIFSKAKYEIAVILLVYLFIDLSMAYLIYKISKSYGLEKQLELLTQQSQFQLNAYKDLNNKYNSSRMIMHDVRKHLSAIEGLVNKNNIDEVKTYKSLLEDELDKLIPEFICDNPILSVIVGNKLIVARNNEIKFELNIEFSKLDFIGDLDITVIFSNLLDNAFEACSELPENERKVCLSVLKRNSSLFIFLENSFKSVELKERNTFRSTKDNHYGIGLMNIKNAVEKYGGYFNVGTENGLFISEITIPLEK